MYKIDYQDRGVFVLRSMAALAGALVVVWAYGKWVVHSQHPALVYYIPAMAIVYAVLRWESKASASGRERRNKVQLHHLALGVLGDRKQNSVKHNGVNYTVTKKRPSWFLFSVYEIYRDPYVDSGAYDTSTIRVFLVSLRCPYVGVHQGAQPEGTFKYYRHHDAEVEEIIQELLDRRKAILAAA